MKPSTDQPAGADRSRTLRRYGPVIAVVAILAVVATALVVTRGNDDGDKKKKEEVAKTGDFPEGAISFAEAEEDGLDVEFPETCDPETGRVAIPYYFAGQCFANVEGDNGGETALGVTGEAIKVVVYLPIDNDPILEIFAGSVGVEDTADEAKATYEGYTALFQEYYQTYGRTVELTFLRATGNALDEVAGRADAVRAAEEEPFAVWGGPALTTAFADELAARQVFCLGCLGGGLAEWYEERAPYPLPVNISTEQIDDHLIEYIDKKLAGRPAVHAGDESLQDKERVFGAINLELTDESVKLAERFDKKLEEADVNLAVRIPYTFDPGRLQEQADSIMARMKSEGVTTVVLFNGDPVTPANLTQAATSQDYFPEWVATGTLVDTNVFGRTYDQEQWAHAFGPSSSFAPLKPKTDFSWYLYEWFNGEEPPAPDTNALLFPQPALFFNAVQSAGPTLTPENFRDGLFATQPLPGDVVTAPSISFGDKGIWPYTDYAGIDDTTEIWWDSEAVGPDEIRQEGPGVYRYVDGGKRYLPGEWTDDESKVFDPEGSVIVYDEPPEGERPPDYPSPAEGN